MNKYIKKFSIRLERFFFGGIYEQDNKNKALLYDFTNCKNKILSKNKEEIINKMIPIIQESIYKADNLLITEEQAKTAAIEIFNTAKEMGNIDCLNKVVR